jgi:ABC-2 type transport system ATP-binding protein
VELTVPERERPRAVAALATAVAEPPGGDGEQISVPAPLGVRSLHEVLHRLETAGITADWVSLRRPTLDEVFLTLTGHRAAAPVPPGPPVAPAATGKAP